MGGMTPEQQRAIEYQRHEELAQTMIDLSRQHAEKLEETRQLSDRINQLAEEHKKHLAMEDRIFEQESARINAELQAWEQSTRETISAQFRHQLETRKQQITHIVIPECAQMMVRFFFFFGDFHDFIN